MPTLKALAITALGSCILSGTAVGAFADSGVTSDRQQVDPPRRVASLNGDYSKSADTTDPNAAGRVRLTLHEGDAKICYRVRVSGMTTRAVYVFRRSDDVLMTRLYDEAPTEADVLKGCVAEVPTEVLRRYVHHPERFYVQASSYDGWDEIGGTLRRPQ